MNLNLTNKRALVTGSTEGIGRAIAQSLAAEGARVIINGRNRQKAQAIADTIPGATVAIGDLSTPAGAAQAIAEIRAGGPLDILINNVGFFEVKPLAQLEDADWQGMFDKNVMSSVRMSKAFLPEMLQRKTGRIVFIASEQSAKPNPEMLHYAMTKAAQVSISRGLAELTRGTGVTVNSVLVAPTWTEGVERFLGDAAKEAGTTRDALRDDYFVNGDGVSSLIARFAQPEEIAAQVTFLCSSQAAAVNGAAQRVDGGIIRSML
ncbi:MAG: SDR family oxidoreductase [Nibricoccus sp.]